MTKSIVPQITPEQEAHRQLVLEKITMMHTKPDQELCPTMFITWMGIKDKVKYRKFYNSKTGEIETCPEKVGITNKIQTTNNNLIRNAGRCADALYCRYYPAKTYGLDVLEISPIAITLNRGKEGVPRNWTFSDITNESSCYLPRLFLFKGDVRVYRKNGNEYQPHDMNSYYNVTFVKTLQQDYQRLYQNATILSEIEKFTGADSIKSYTYTGYQDNNLYINIYHFSRWYKNSLERKMSKTACALAEINQLITIDPNSYDKLVPIIFQQGDKNSSNYNKRYDRYLYRNFLAFEIHDNWGVFRYITRGERDGYCSERLRIFVSPKGKVSIMELQNNNWNLISQNIRSALYCSLDAIGFIGADNFPKIQNLKYLMNILGDSKDYDGSTLVQIVEMLRHPIIEKLVKSGYNNIAKKLCKHNTITADIKNCFNGKETAKSSLTETFGLNSYQLKKIDKMLNNTQGYSFSNRSYHVYSTADLLNKGLISCVKSISGTNNLSGLSNKTTDEVFTFCEKLLSISRMWKYDFIVREGNDNVLFRPFRGWYRRNSDDEILTDEDRAHMKRVQTICGANAESLSLFRDLIRLMLDLPADRRLAVNPYKLRDIRAVNELHDNITVLLNDYRAEQRALWDKAEAERIKQRDENLKKHNAKREQLYAYETENYNFIIPKKCDDLITEGTVQSICIGSYTNAYAERKTDLVFIRKKGYENVPFFAVEVEPETGKILQAHGKFNCWMGTHPELIKEFIQWIRAKGLKCYANIILNKSQRYSNTGQYLNAKDYGLKGVDELIS